MGYDPKTDPGLTVTIIYIWEKFFFFYIKKQETLVFTFNSIKDRTHRTTTNAAFKKTIF